MNNDTYIINDLTNLAISIRKNSALSFSGTYTENLDDFISIAQVENIIVQHTDIDDDGNMIIDEDQYNTIFDEVSNWLFNIGLAKLAAEDKIQCAWDDENNCMIFWHNENDKNSCGK